MKDNQHIHFIGICGVAMSALAIAFNKAGWQVSGSDAGFHPPISTNLEKNKIKFYPGWHVDKMTKAGDPDLVIVGNVASSTNPEWIYVQKQKLNYLSYPEAIAKYFVKSNSIVCAGTYGKTTTSTLLAWILSDAGYNPSYMFGGLAIDNNLPSAQISSGQWSILEGDEYKTARWDNSPKFTHYSPTHLMLTAIQWDHMDVYPTKNSYLNAFKKLISSIPKNGQAVVSNKINKNIIKLFNCPIISYGTNNADYQYTNIQTDKEGIKFDIINDNNTYQITSQMLGKYMAENITACFAMADKIGIETKKIIEAIYRFKGIKRRLEKRFQGDITIFDDIAHSPAKASFTLKTLHKIYPDSKILAVFEPNTGNRRQQSINGYNQAFKNADEVIIPRLTKIKIDPNDPNKPMDGKKLTEIIAQTYPQVNYIVEDNKLVNYLKTKTQTNDVVVFLGSHGFRGMIEKLIKITEV